MELEGKFFVVWSPVPSELGACPILRVLAGGCLVGCSETTGL